MRVLMLSDFFLSGQTTHVLELTKQLRKLGVDKSNCEIGRAHV